MAIVNSLSRLNCRGLVHDIQSFWGLIFVFLTRVFYRVGCQPHSQPPTWRTRSHIYVPWDGVVQLYPRHWVPITVASYDPYGLWWDNSISRSPHGNLKIFNVSILATVIWLIHFFSDESLLHFVNHVTFSWWWNMFLLTVLILMSAVRESFLNSHWKKFMVTMSVFSLVSFYSFTLVVFIATFKFDYFYSGLSTTLSFYFYLAPLQRF